MIVNGRVIITFLLAEDMAVVINTTQGFNLDFDDADQYAVAKRYNLSLVSFNSDIDRTERGRKTPAEVVQEQSP